MPDIEPLLKPISDDKPSGDDLRYAPVYDKIRNSRKLEDTSPKGKWEEADAAVSDFQLVAKLASETIATKSKDLQLVAWLAEAWTWEEGIKGLTSGIDLARELLVRFWDTLHPELDEGDAEMRVSNLDWIGTYFDPAKGSSPIFALRSIPLTVSGHSWFVYQESRRIGYETEVTSNPARKAVREAAVKDKKVTPEAFDKDFEATKKAFYKELGADCKALLASVNQLDELCHEKFKDSPPSFTPMRKAIEEVANVTHILLLKKLEKEPDPVEPVAAAEPEAAAETAEGETPAEDQSVASTSNELEGGAIRSEAQAMLHAVAAAHFIRRQNPASPTSYLLLRALRWGELRGAQDVNQIDLPAPLPDVRRALRSAAAANNWKSALELAETAMSNPYGRGWLDLQRYTIRACTELGYVAAAKALRSELKNLLVDFPNLAKATLNDDTGTANPETLEWLKKEGILA